MSHAAPERTPSRASQLLRSAAHHPISRPSESMQERNRK
ncbi:hypothetical protein PFLCHA0_c29120 [Pseudomonas protegens CHA0]|uniref:Uncharacterized protein n=1 Tax=Pseudomonas protegens (strain DSM 19095 / LMG 27888 / CFBP 6595 / CHA0) TaxID=1124983 RepID=A0A2C9ELZ4_PSEPH|nr:hypothetical protein PFLCHA0_c29120 [Pseudomonas protegens CHA0]